MMWSWLIIFQMLICRYFWSIYSIWEGKTAVFGRNLMKQAIIAISFWLIHPTSVIRKNPYGIEPELIRRQKEDKFLIRNYQELILDPKLWPGLNRCQNLLNRPENSWFPYHWGRTSRLPLFGPEFRNNRPKRPLFAQFWLVLALFWFFLQTAKNLRKKWRKLWPSKLET